MTDPTIDLLRRLDPAAGNDPARAVGADSRTELLTRIMQADLSAGDGPDTAGEVGRRALAGTVETARGRSGRRQFLVRRVVPGLVAAGLVGGIAVSVVGLPGGSRQEALGPALSFTTEGNFLHVKIVDPEADSARYNKEFKAHHLDIQLVLEPASPSQVGRNIAQGSSEHADPITSTVDPAGCDDAGTYPCVPQFVIPKDYHGSLQLYIGRAARPDENLVANGAIDDRGEPLAGLRWRNKRVSEVLALLAQRGYTVPEYRVTKKNFAESPKTVPLNWFVTGGFLFKGKQVVLEASPTR